MKKLIFITMLLAAMLATSFSFAQVSFGVKGSLNMFNLAMKDSDGKKVESKMIPAFDLGAYAEIPLVDEFYIRPELIYAAKGAKSKDLQPEYTVHTSWIELPVLFLYKGAFASDKVLLGFGPYLAMGVGGKVKSDIEDIDVKFKNDVSESDSVALYYKPIDFGAKIMAGYELSNGLSFAINASLGLSNIEPKYSGKTTDAITKNVGFGLTLAYRFGK
jgi:hypothetical protein